MTATAHAPARTVSRREEQKPLVRAQPKATPKAKARTAPSAKAAPKRLEARTSAEIHSFIEAAATLSGRSVTDLMLAGTMREAREAIEQAQVLRLSLESQMLFAKALLSPPEPNAALRKAMETHTRLISSDEV